MSNKKAKDGEHGTLALFALAALNDDRLEVMRYSETNVPDMGQDIFLKASNRWVRELAEVTNPCYSPHPKFSELGDDVVRSVRIDVKTSEVIDKTLAQKTIDDIKKHPKTDTHVLFGGRLTKEAQLEIKQIRLNYPSKEILHVSDSGIKALASRLDIPVKRLFPYLKDET
jgi:hypothetical protein